MSRQKILIMDDEPDIGAFIATVAESRELDAKIISKPARFMETYTAHDPDIVVLDLQMPGMDGVELLKLLAGVKSQAKILLVSGMDTRVRNTAVRLGEELGLNMAGTLQKPILLDVLEDTLHLAMKHADDVITREMLEQTLEENQLQVYYQPKLDLQQSGYPAVGVESLVRWIHPERGIIPPDSFLPLAEESGLIRPMTETIIDQTLAQYSAWRACGLDLDVAINLSPMLLDDTQLPDKLYEKTCAANIDPARITVEVTESAAMEDTGKAAEILTRFRIKGFKVSIDDFGTGFSSLVHLHQLPFSELKIDRSFVMECMDDGDAQTITRTIAQLAHSLGMSVCAEGIETEEICTWLKDLECTTGQGFHFSKPRPGNELTDWLFAHNNLDCQGNDSDSAAANR